jgi:hypothetical protein
MWTLSQPISTAKGAAPHSEEFVIAYLKQWLTNVRTEMPTDPPFPFYLVNRLSGGDDMVSDYPTLSIHCFHTSRQLASDAADVMHAKMKALTARSAVLVRGVNVGVDYIEVVETPMWVDYNDPNIKRYVGRYKFGLRLT